MITLLTCSFGNPHIGSTPVGGYHCVKCLREGLRQHRLFWAGVAEGRWDRDGYTPKDRRAQEKHHGRA